MTCGSTQIHFGQPNPSVSGLSLFGLVSTMRVSTSLHIEEFIGTFIPSRRLLRSGDGWSICGDLVPVSSATM